MKEHSLLGNHVYSCIQYDTLNSFYTRICWCFGLANMKQLTNMFNSAAEKPLQKRMADGIPSDDPASSKTRELQSVLVYEFVPFFDDLQYLFGLLHDSLPLPY